MIGASALNGNHDTLTSRRPYRVTRRKSPASTTSRSPDGEHQSLPGDGVWSVSGIAGLGAAVSSHKIDGSSQAIIGNFTEIGTSAGAIAGGVTVDAQRTVTINPFNAGDPMGIAIGGGLFLGVAAGVTLID